MSDTTCMGYLTRHWKLINTINCKTYIKYKIQVNKSMRVEWIFRRWGVCNSSPQLTDSPSPTLTSITFCSCPHLFIACRRRAGVDGAPSLPISLRRLKRFTSVDTFAPPWYSSCSCVVVRVCICVFMFIVCHWRADVDEAPSHPSGLESDCGSDKVESSQCLELWYDTMDYINVRPKVDE